MNNSKHLLTTLVFLGTVCLGESLSVRHCIAQGAVELQFIDKDSGDPISARMQFTKSAKKLSRPRKMLFAGEQWLAEKKFPLATSNGEYEFLVQRGPEFNEIRGGFTIEPRARDVVAIEVPRSIKMHPEHWYSGDHLCTLPRNELSRWQAADAVDFVASTDGTQETQARNKKLVKQDDVDPNGLGLFSLSRLAEWEHGCIILHGMSSDELKSDGATSLKLLEDSRNEKSISAEIIRPWTRDVPLLLASNTIRSVQILSSHNRPTGDDRLTLDKNRIGERLGKVILTNGKTKISSNVFANVDSDEEIRFKDARGVGKLSEFIYWQMLEAGFKMTPTAGSGFNGNETQVGYNRVYVYSEVPPNPSLWWKAIEQGQTFVTNGPLLRVTINGLLPGSIQTSYRSQNISLDITANLAVRDPVDYLDVVFNGETIYSAKLEDHYQKGEFPPIEISESGWLVVRVVTENIKGYRFATTAPFYFVFDSSPRISRKAVSFFQRWQTAALKDISESPSQMQSYEPWLSSANQFWNSRLSDCTCD